MNKILIIEDDPNIMLLLSAAFKKNSFTVVSAQDGLQGTSMLRKEEPDLVILDLIIPGGGGLKVLRNLKMSVCTSTIPVIVLSGTNDEKLIEEVNSLGVEAFIEKPFDTEMLVAKVKEVLSQKR